jgi:hypothetical protein
MRSESTVALGQPRLTNPTVGVLLIDFEPRKPRMKKAREYIELGIF